MKKLLLFSLIGAIVLFAWQFLSFGFPNFHKSAAGYTKAQDSILSKIREANLPEGMYWLGQADPKLSTDEQAKYMTAHARDAWAIMNYHKTNTMSMTMPMIRSFLVSFVTSMLLFWIFLQQGNPTLRKRLSMALAIGLIAFFYFPYSNFIWYKQPDIFAYFADGLVPWIVLALIGHKMAMPKK